MSEIIQYEDVKRVLLSADSPKEFSPEGFDATNEYLHVKKFAGALSKSAKWRVYVEDPSGFQDGSLFTRLLLSEGASDVVVAQILISTFGRLVTISGDYDERTLKLVRRLLKSYDYLYIPEENLRDTYDGDFTKFSRMSWFQRFFCTFYQAKWLT